MKLEPKTRDNKDVGETASREDVCVPLEDRFNFSSSCGRIQITIISLPVEIVLKLIKGKQGNGRLSNVQMWEARIC